MNGHVDEAADVKPGAVTRNSGPYSCTRAAPCTVPPDHVWVMGDNRDHSSDSRSIGPVPVDRVVGRAFARIWPLGRLGGL